jgi:hypothetical protein
LAPELFERLPKVVMDRRRAAEVIGPSVDGEADKLFELSLFVVSMTLRACPELRVPPNMPARVSAAIEERRGRAGLWESFEGGVLVEDPEVLGLSDMISGGSDGEHW